jgi:hypothetical protein
MKQTIISMLIAFVYFSLAVAQATSYDAASCVSGSGVTALPNCDFISQQQTNCNASLPKAEQISCLCNQKVFNAIVEYV